jgi:cation diffusion facilitator CzcD-associated flavoprotein CzcO
MVDGARGGEEPARYDAVVIGAGFAGLYAVHRLREVGLTVKAFEAGAGVGGTWYWNRYPGARCDTKSLDYSYSFSEELEQEWNWTEDYATQEEILRYLNHVADRFDLRQYFQFDTFVTSAVYDEGQQEWRLGTGDGQETIGRFCIMAVGPLSAANRPNIAGLDSFAGEMLYTASWPADGVDLTGRRVGIIGTGSSAVQAIPVIAQDAAELFVFQRTANFVIPAHNRPLKPEFQQDWKANYRRHRAKARQTPNGLSDTPGDISAFDVSEEERTAAYEAAWAEGGPKFVRVFKDLLTNIEANDTASEFVKAKIRSRIRDPHVADLLCPTLPIGGKRSPADTHYFEAYNRDNVHLIDIRKSPIVAIEPGGLRTQEAEYAFDTLILATGFDAMTGALSRIDIRGKAGQPLRDKWSAGPRTYLGLSTANFPNFFIVAGPGSPSVTCNMALAAEQHVDWIAECILYLRAHGLRTIEATEQSEDEWVDQVNAEADKTLFPTVDSWYLGSNIEGKPRVFMPYVGGAHVYRKICDEVTREGYRGFALSAGPKP